MVKQIKKKPVFYCEKNIILCILLLMRINIIMSSRSSTSILLYQEKTDFMCVDENLCTYGYKYMFIYMSVHIHVG